MTEGEGAAVVALALLCVALALVYVGQRVDELVDAVRIAASRAKGEV